MRVIAIKDMSSGNDSVGEMWQETKIFTEDTKLLEVMQWVGMNKTVRLSIPDGDYLPPENKLPF